MTDTLAYVSETTGDGYRLGETLGAGAVASVVRVTDAQGGVFAGKVLHASHEQDEGALARFMQEARSCGTSSTKTSSMCTAPWRSRVVGSS